MTNDSGMPDELHIEVTEEDYRTAREMMARSELGHCFRCLKPRPPEGAPDAKDWSILTWEEAPGGEIFLAICPNCNEAVENWLCGEFDEILGEPKPYPSKGDDSPSTGGLAE